MAELKQYNIRESPVSVGIYYRADEVDKRIAELEAQVVELVEAKHIYDNSIYGKMRGAYVEQRRQLSRAHAALRDAPVMEDTDRIQCGCHFEQKGWRECHEQAIKEANQDG